MSQSMFVSLCRSFAPFASLAIVLFPAPSRAQAVEVRNAGDVAAFFSPNGGAEAAVVESIDQAKRSILVQAYSFTSAPIYEALARAKARGVDVRVLVDKSNASSDFRGQGARYDLSHGVPLWIDPIPGKGIAHSKIMIIDAITVIAGSFNWSRAAETTNTEVLLIFRNNAPMANAFTQNWMNRARHAVTYSSSTSESSFGRSED